MSSREGWGEECQASLGRIQELIISEPALIVPDIDDLFFCPDRCQCEQPGMRASAEEGRKSEALSVPQQETVSPGDTIRSHRAVSSSYRLGTAEII